MLTVNAYGVTSATEPLAPMTTSRRDPKPGRGCAKPGTQP